VLRALIEAGADVNQEMDNGATPLFVAAHMGHEAVVRLLLGAGVEATYIPGYPMTSLLLAARECLAANVQILRDLFAV
jgi:ankyrin repeat protein